MPSYKKDEKGKMMIKPTMLDEWENMDDYIRRIRKEAKDKSRTLKDKVKDGLIKKIKEI
jgi:hypothetical protein